MMRFGSATLAALSLSYAAHAAELPILGPTVGPAVTAASLRIGGHVDWGAGECGPPQYLAGVCVWSLGRDFSLTSLPVGSVVSRWSAAARVDAVGMKVFRDACSALVAALHPAWTPRKVEAFVFGLIDRARTDQEIRADGMLHAFYIFGDATFTCEAQPG